MDKEFNQWWDDQVKGAPTQWTTLERIAALSAWQEAKKRYNALNKSSDISPIVHQLSYMIEKREEIRRQGYTDDNWRDYELNEAQLKHLKRTKNLILAEKR